MPPFRIAARNLRFTWGTNKLVRMPPFRGVPGLLVALLPLLRVRVRVRGVCGVDGGGGGVAGRAPLLVL